MMGPVSLRLATLLIWTTSAIQVDAKEWREVAPRWLDQTIHQPNCSGDCECDCLSDRLCVPACIR